MWHVIDSQESLSCDSDSDFWSQSRQPLSRNNFAYRSEFIHEFIALKSVTVVTNIFSLFVFFVLLNDKLLFFNGALFNELSDANVLL